MYVKFLPINFSNRQEYKSKLGMILGDNVMLVRESEKEVSKILKEKGMNISRSTREVYVCMILEKVIG